MTDAIKILSIGNSFSEDAQAWLLELLPAGSIVANLYMPGQSLAGHREQLTYNLADYSYQKRTAAGRTNLGSDIKYGLLDEDWDYVTLQQSSGLSGVINSYGDDIGYLVDVIKRYRPQAKICWHMTWAYARYSEHPDFKNYGNNQLLMQKAIHQCLERVIQTDKRIDIILPTGDAIQKARSLVEAEEELTRDGFHLSYLLGRYIAALSWAQRLIGELPNWAPAGMTASELLLARKAVRGILEDENG